MEQADCIFCRIVKREIPAHLVHEDDDFIAFLDIKPVNLGHVLLVPKTHVRNLFDMPADLLAKVGPQLKALATAVKSATQSDGINIGMNNEPAAGQLVFHAHLHVIPRLSDDGFKHWHGKSDYVEEDFIETREKIKASLH